MSPFSWPTETFRGARKTPFMSSVRDDSSNRTDADGLATVAITACLRNGACAIICQRHRATCQLQFWFPLDAVQANARAFVDFYRILTAIRTLFFLQHFAHDRKLTHEELQDLSNWLMLHNAANYCKKCTTLANINTRLYYTLLRGIRWRFAISAGMLQLPLSSCNSQLLRHVHQSSEFIGWDALYIQRYPEVSCFTYFDELILLCR
jgi:hypothetical protein